MKYGGFIPVRSGGSVPAAVPVMVREPPEGRERIDRLIEELNGSAGGPDVLEPELDRPGDR